MADGAGVMGAEGGLAMGTGIDFITSKDEWGRCGFEKRYESISCRVACSPTYAASVVAMSYNVYMGY